MVAPGGGVPGLSPGVPVPGQWEEQQEEQQLVVLVVLAVALLWHQQQTDRSRKGHPCLGTQQQQQQHLV